MNEIVRGIAWKDSYTLGNGQVDAQHKKLFALVSELVKSCQDGTDAEKLQETLTFLVDYTVWHFQFEEHLQMQYGYPEYEKHKELHEDFKGTVGELVARFEQSGSTAELSGDVNRIVVKWLISHIMREDKKIGEHIRKMDGPRKT